MAIDTVQRWRTVRDAIALKKSGTLIAQSGRNYIYWKLHRGNLVCVSSNAPEFSLNLFIREKQLVPEVVLLGAQSQVDENRSLGAVLVRQGVLSADDLKNVLKDHWIVCSETLFDPSIHVFWSGEEDPCKPQFVRFDLPFGEVLLKVARDSITIPTALRAVQFLKQPFKLNVSMVDSSRFNDEEKRILLYLQSGSSLDRIFEDRQITKIPCYKILFILWLCGCLSDTRPVPATPKEVVTMSFLQKMKNMPADWIIPLCAGVLVGVLLAPSTAQQPNAKPGHRIEPLRESLDRPAWSTDTERTEKEEERMNSNTNE